MQNNLIVKERLYDAVNLGLPIFFLVISILSFIWFAIEVKKKRIEFKTMIMWFTLNILLTVVFTYILILSVLHFYGIDKAANLFNLISEYAFGLTLDNGKEWVILLILSFISYTLLKTLKNSILISKLNKRVDSLAKEVAILNGRINKTAEFTTKIAIPQATAKEIKTQLKEKVKIAIAEKRAKQKIDMLNEKANAPKSKVIKSKTIKNKTMKNKTPKSKTIKIKTPKNKITNSKAKKVIKAKTAKSAKNKT